MSSPNVPSIEVVEAVADREGVDPADLREPLGDYVDPEKLHALLESGPVAVIFEYLDYEVTVRHTGEIELETLPSS
jgi:hypothetical protein